MNNDDVIEILSDSDGSSDNDGPTSTTTKLQCRALNELKAKNLDKPPTQTAPQTTISNLTLLSIDTPFALSAPERTQILQSIFPATKKKIEAFRKEFEKGKVGAALKEDEILTMGQAKWLQTVTSTTKLTRLASLGAEPVHSLALASHRDVLHAPFWCRQAPLCHQQRNHEHPDQEQSRRGALGAANSRIFDHAVD